MNDLQVTIAFFIFFITAFLVIGLVRKQVLRVSYSIVWITFVLVLIIFVGGHSWIVKLDSALELGGPKNIFFFMVIFFLLSVCIQFSLMITSLVVKVKNLAQKIAFLEYEINSTKD